MLSLVCALATSYVAPFGSSAFVGSRAALASAASTTSRAAPVAMSSGFGTKKIVGKSEKGRATKPGVYDKLKKTGVPEYSVFVRESESAAWRSAGVLCVPRTASVAEAVSKAIYTREQELCNAIGKAYPDLKQLDSNVLQFGFRPAEFESDPIEMATRDKAADTKNFFAKVRATNGNALPA
jgi:L-rhamnose mutarotase